MPSQKAVGDAGLLRPGLLERISHGGAPGVKKLNSATALIQIQPRRLPHGVYVLHRFGCSQENDRLLREGRQWAYLRSRFDTRYTIRVGYEIGRASCRERV